MSRLSARAAACALLVLPLAAALAAELRYPPTPKHPVVDTIQGVKIEDDYRWLENGNDPAVKRWDAEQNALTRSVLDAVPQRPELRARLQQLLGEAPFRYADIQNRGRVFALKRQPPKNQPFLVVMDDADPKTERVVLDPNRIDAKGTTAIDFYVPSLDGRYVAVALSQGGSEQGPAVVYEVATGRKLDDVVPRVQYPTGGGSIAWDATGSGFFYTRYPQGDERPKEDANFYQQVYFHKLGSPASADTYALGKDFPRIAETHLDTSRDGRYVLATVANGDGGEYAFWLHGPDGAWKRFADFADRIRHVALGMDGNLYALSLKDAPRGKVVRMPMDAPDLAKAAVIVPEGDATIESLQPTKALLYVDYMVGGPSEVRVLALDGKPRPPVPTPPVSTVSLGEWLGGDDVLIAIQSYVQPFAWYRYSPAHDRLEKTALAGESKVRFDDAEVVREMAVSRDGTQVPVNILMKKGTRLDGSHPVILYGYGGYGINMQPYFSPSNRLWLDHGGIYAVANIRGGGEFGEAWHLAGNLSRKQNVFDDFIAAGEHLVKRGYTAPAKLSAMGGSNGGLLMGAVLTQRPDLWRAVVSQVGIYDMLRVELTPNGAFNVTEFGSVKDPAQFKALYAYSPYHRVKDGVAYPAVLLTTGAHDGRVDPYNSRKMAARLQAASSSGRPVLLRIEADTGHGIGTGLSTRVEEYADTFAFLFSQLGVR